MSVNSSLWQNHVVLIVTGASKGFGRAIVSQFINSFHEYHGQKRNEKKRNEKNEKEKNEQERNTDYGMKVVLSARDEVALKNFMNELETSNNSTQFEEVIGSMEDESIMEKFKSVFRSVVGGTEEVILVHNAGSLSDPSKLVEDYGPEETSSLNLYFASNVTPMITLTGLFLKTFEPVEKKIIVNVSSLAAVSPLKGLSIYGAGKAARDAFMKSVASEAPNVKVINYAPGPLKTAMAEQLRTKSYMKEFFEHSNNILDPDDSARKLLSILTKDSFLNGSHVDFYDPL